MSAKPLVSCICITKNRRLFVRRALEFFARSKYLYEMIGGKAELVIVDGSDKPTASLTGPDVHYIHLGPSQEGNVGRMGLLRNVACEATRGELVIHWDDDDWHHPYRIVRQAQTLEPLGEGFTYSTAFWSYHISSCRASRAKGWTVGEGTVGALFAYHRSAWQASRFREDCRVEDLPWCNDQMARGTTTVDSKDPELCVHMRHNVNSSAFTNYRFSDEDTRDARALMGADVDWYDELAEILPLTPWNHPNAPGSKMHALNPLQMLHLRHFR